MEEKFTKGEWELSESLHGSAALGVLEPNSDIVICDVHSTNCTQIVTHEAIANAHLIKTSPKMYRMLEKLKEECEMFYSEFGAPSSDEYQAVFVEIDELLAEARGEQ